MNKTKPIKFLIIGRTASGKSSIARAVCDRLGLQLVKSYTTRPPREEEKKMSSKDTDHYFIDDMYMDEFISYDEVAAYTEINGYKYFVTKDILDKSDIYVIDPIGVDDLEKRCGDEYKFIKIYIRVNEQVAKQRFISRGGTVEEFFERYESESKQFSRYEKSQLFDYHLLNTNKTFDEAVNKVCEWIQKELSNE